MTSICLEQSRIWNPCGTNVDLDEPTTFLDHVYLGSTQSECTLNEIIMEQQKEMFESRTSAEAPEKLPGLEKLPAKTVAWSYDMEGHAQKRVDRYCELANKKTEQLYKVSIPCLDDHRFKEELESVGELSNVCSQIVLKCLYLARIGEPDILRSVHKLARAVTKWKRACHIRLVRLISYIYHTIEHRQCGHVRNKAQHCRLGSFQDTDFAGDHKNPKSTSGRVLSHFHRIGNYFFGCWFGRNSCS